jgi:hypothetical protein
MIARSARLALALIAATLVPCLISAKAHADRIDLYVT